jgi:hypothetical protein
MDKVQNPSYSERYTPSSESFRIYVYIYMNLRAHCSFYVSNVAFSGCRPDFTVVVGTPKKVSRFGTDCYVIITDFLDVIFSVLLEPRGVLVL